MTKLCTHEYMKKEYDFSSGIRGKFYHHHSHRGKVTANVLVAEEWAKIEKLAVTKGKNYKSVKDAKKHIKTI